ncbi:Isochorismatase-like protein [Mycena vitilis]|nr:Isochorismatase-like protein [Mycena vitilis]
MSNKSYLNRGRSTPNLQPNITSLLAEFRSRNLPVIHIHHVNTKKLQERTLVVDGERVLRKFDKSSAFGAFLVSDGMTSLSDVFSAEGVETVILQVVGISSPHCVSSTARSACDQGLSVIVVGDATATHAADVVEVGGSKGDSKDGTLWSAETVHVVAMAHLNDEFANVVTTAEVLKYL